MKQMYVIKQNGVVIYEAPYGTIVNVYIKSISQIVPIILIEPYINLMNNSGITKQAGITIEPKETQNTETTKIYSNIYDLFKDIRSTGITLDLKYKDHISNSKKLFTISIFNGQIREINKKEYTPHIPLFRSIEDAKKACKIYSKELRKFYGE